MAIVYQSLPYSEVSRPGLMELFPYGTTELRHPEILKSIQEDGLIESDFRKSDLLDNPSNEFSLAPEQWIAKQTHLAMVALNECVERLPSKLGGIPVVKGTRFAVSQLFIELADSDEIDEIADNYEVDAHQLKKIMQALSVCLDEPMVE